MDGLGACRTAIFFRCIGHWYKQKNHTLAVQSSVCEDEIMIVDVPNDVWIAWLRGRVAVISHQKDRNNDIAYDIYRAGGLNEYDQLWIHYQDGAEMKKPGVIEGGGSEYIDMIFDHHKTRGYRKCWGSRIRKLWNFRGVDRLVHRGYNGSWLFRLYFSIHT